MEVNKVQKVYKKQELGKEQSSKASEKLSGSSNRSNKEVLCFACNKGDHNFAKCKFKLYKCKKCKVKGHIEAACKASVHVVEEMNEVAEMFTLDKSFRSDPIYVEVLLNGLPFKMEVDTGAGLSCMPLEIYEKHFKNVPLSDTQIKLKTYNGSIIKPKGKICLRVSLQGLTKECDLIIVEKGCRLLLGRDLLKSFEIDLSKQFKGDSVKKDVKNFVLDVNSVDVNSELIRLLEKFEDLFKNELGCYNGSQISLEVDPNVKPIFCKPRPIPYAYREAVKKEMSRLVELGVIEKVDNAQWGTPLVVAMKPNGRDIRLCANYKATINKHLPNVNHPFTFN